MRSRLYLERVVHDDHEPDPDRRSLRTMKANYGPVGDQLSLTWRDGVFVADTAPTYLDKLASGAHTERVFLTLLDEFDKQGRRVNASSGPNYVPAQFASNSKAEGITKHAFKRAMDDLLSRGTIMNQSEGPPSRRVHFLTRSRR